ncbi:hypothetical protein PROFUN_02344 [Planoprotostelium fungivorum]|uniref:Pre-mRNA-splicing factor SYF2 n=1 Tax=Planoprotostelium fungivorum TaxID=1890364 RepID=A0A2P6NYN3_9EUKA|nr:hypothetical protein PROFUN_02344 [Planoprotostelium fungivorum]
MSNAIPFQYENTPDLPRAPKELHAPSEDELSTMTPAQQRLAQLRAKASAARRKNHAEAVAEDARNKEDAHTRAEKARQEYKTKLEKEEEELKEQGLDPKKEKMLNTTAAEAEYQNAWKDRKKDESFGWGQFNTEKDYKVYHKRMKSAEKVFSQYDEAKDKTREEDFFPTAHNLNYGQGKTDTKEKVEFLLDEMGKARQKNREFSRKRIAPEGAYVNYINDRNKEFNRQVSKAYDKYTVEIRQNLERGTAI